MFVSMLRPTDWVFRPTLVLFVPSDIPVPPNNNTANGNITLTLPSFVEVPANSTPVMYLHTHSHVYARSQSQHTHNRTYTTRSFFSLHVSSLLCATGSDISP